MLLRAHAVVLFACWRDNIDMRDAMMPFAALPCRYAAAS